MTTGQAERLAAGMVGFVRAFGLHRPAETPCARPIPLGEAHALMDLAEHGPLSHGELAARLKLQKSTVSRLVRQLQKRSWVVRDVSSEDKRVRLVRLTRKGLAAAKRLAFARQDKFASLLAAIPRAERTLVLNALTILTRALERKPS